MLQTDVNKPIQWAAELTRLSQVGTDEARKMVEAGLRMAEDTHPVYRAVNLLIAQHATIEAGAFLLPNITSVEYQRGRLAALFDLHTVLCQMAEATKSKPPVGSG
jgi:hypothetical protein